MTLNISAGAASAPSGVITNNVLSSGVLDVTALNGGPSIYGDGSLMAGGLRRPSGPANPAATMKSWSEILKTRVAPGAPKPAGFGKAPVTPAPSQNKNTSVPALFNRSGKTWKVPGVPEFKGQVRGELMVGLDQALTPRRMQVFDGLSEGQQITARTLIGAALDAMSLPAGSAGRIDPKHMGAVVDASLKYAQQIPTALDAAAKPQARTPTTRPVPPAQITRTPTTQPVPPAQTARTPNRSAAAEVNRQLSTIPDLQRAIDASNSPTAIKNSNDASNKMRDRGVITNSTTRPGGDVYAEMQAAFDAPMPADVQSRLTPRWSRIDQRAENVARQVNLNADTPSARVINEALMMPRMQLASSHYPQKVGQKSAVQSIDNWQSAEATVLGALRANVPITVANIKVLNSVFGQNQPQPVVRGVTQRFGEYRTTPMTPSGFPNRKYLPPESIDRAMSDFQQWYERAENSGMHPVQIAAQAYGRLSSIHPFPDANGRTARLVMNWILRSHGLPPAALAPEHIDRMLVDVGGSSVVPTPGALEQELTSAVERSLDVAESMLRPPPSRGRGFGQ